MSVINAGRVQPQHKATWNSATSYIKTDIVLYNGNGYWCIQDNVNKVPNTETSYWSLMVQRGSDADLTQLENSVIYKTGDQAITGGLELTKGVFSSGFDQTSLPSDKNGTSTYWDTTSPIGGITGGIGRVAAFIKSAAGTITYKALGLGAYVSNKFSLLLNADGSAVFGGTVTLNSDPTSNLHAATKYYVDYQRATVDATAVHKSGAETITGEKTFSVSPIVPNPTASTDAVNKYSLLTLIYPVGSIYMSVNNVSPAVFLGGTWEAMTNRFLVGAGGAYGVNTTGGEESHVLSIHEMPSHGHPLGPGQTFGMNFGSNGGAGATFGVAVSFANGNTYQGPYSVLENGGNGAHNNMPPYLAVYMWKRTS